jgi:ABC-type Zn2+ transport system substrate-binding protein/surface adhesin
MFKARAILLASTLLAASALSAHAEVNVVASIKPVHSLVAAVMDGVGEPGLIMWTVPVRRTITRSNHRKRRCSSLLMWCSG